MPKGTKIVDWTNPENDQKLLLAIIKVSDVSKKYGEIATAFGNGVPATSIQLRINKLRSKAKHGEMVTGCAKPAKKNLMTGLKPAAIANKVVVKSEDDETGDESNGDESNHPVTPPKTPNGKKDKVASGRVTKRVSPRKSQAKDYKKLTDPFMDMEAKGDDGENIFGQPGKSEEEESDPNDEEFSAEKKIEEDTAI